MKDTGQFATILSAAAVVLSLAFVGYEIRQNTAMMRGATMQSISDTYVDYVTAIGADPELAELFRRFHAGEVSTVFESYGWRWGMIRTECFEEYWENSSQLVVGSEFAPFFERQVQIGPSAP